ncbi:MAG: response regulator, partial [Alphaproteobacteria bacterium]
MGDVREELEKRLAALRESYRRQLPERVARVEAPWNAGLRSGWDADAARAMRLAAHSLKGSAATYGFMRLSGEASLIEERLDGLLEMQGEAFEEQILQIEAQVAALRLAARSPEAPPTSKGRAGKGTGARRVRSKAPARRVFILDGDHSFAGSLAEQVRHYGYDAALFKAVDSLRAEVAKRKPAAIILDVDLPEGEFAALAAVQAVNEGMRTPVPVVVVTARDDIQARLEAVRNGAVGYFTKPVDVEGLVALLDDLAQVVTPTPYRVLVVDDDRAAAEFHAAALESTGIETMIVTDPLAVMRPLAEFSPDLLLLDMYMPHCTGMEIAGVVRQHPTYASLPIVFLSAEQDRDRQLEAVSFGGADDFITKPVEPERLISSVKARAERLRLLRMLVTQDPMTRLLNHTSVKERLDSELARARRADKPLLFALIDIDHFKRVNDTYGHPAGDSVIRNLARLLRQRLRRGDTVGRYGGEE